MNGGHDLGGMHGLGPVAPERDEPVFHADWERRAFALTLAMGAHGRWHLDRSRFVREDRHPVDYLSSSYYELWVKALERLAGEEGFLVPGEVEAGRALATPPAHAKPPQQKTRTDPSTIESRERCGMSDRVSLKVRERGKCGQPSQNLPSSLGHGRPTH